MNLRAHLRIVGGILCGVAAGSYLLSDVFTPLEGPAFAAAVAAGYLLPTRARRSIPDTAWTVILLLLFAWVSVRTWYVFSDVMLYLYEFARWLLVAKIWGRKSGRDELQILLLSFFVLLGGTVFTFSFAIVPLLMAYVTLAPIGLYLASAAAAKREDELEAGGPFIPFRIYRLAVVSGTLIFLGGGILFFSLPRLSTAIVEFNFSGASSGMFPMGVDLRNQGLLQPGTRVVFRVQADPPLSEAPLWRVQALDHFDGTKWSRTRQAESEIEEPEPGIFVSDPSVLTSEAPTQRFEFDLSPLHLPALIVPAQLAQRSSDSVAVLGPLRRLSWTEAGELRFERSETRRADVLPLSYEVFYFGRVGELDSGEQSLGRRDHRLLTRLPTLLSPEVERLAGELARRADAASMGASEALGRMAYVEEYLSENYLYSLERRAGGSADPVASFLFEEKAGHCEFFASAAAVLLRAQGIPARVVTGFGAGEYDAETQLWTVRESDAHSWVEAWDEQAGWVSIDPSPRDLAAEHARVNPLLLAWQDMRQKTELWWYDWVLKYSLAEQMGLVSTAVSQIPQVTGEKGKGALPDFKGRLPPAQAMWTIGTLVVGAGLFFGFGLFRARAAGKGAARVSALGRLIEPLRKEAKRRGIACDESRTPRELADDLSRGLDNEAGSALRGWVDRYNEVRFAGQNPPGGAGARLKRDWKAVGALLKRSRSA